MDGTLVDSLSGIAQAMNSVLISQGFKLHPVEAYKQFVGEGIEILVERALPPELHVPEKVADFIQLMRREYSRVWRSYGGVYDGLVPVLDELGHLVKLAILSNKPENYTIEFADHFLSRWEFAPVYGAVPEWPNKPDSGRALKIAKELNLPPEQVAFCGDSNIDIKTGWNAGMTTIGVGWGFRTIAELQAAGADIIAEKPADLLAIVSGLSQRK